MRVPRALAVVAVVLAALLLRAPARARPYTGKLYATEQLAQAACDGSAVVWVDPASGRFAVKGNGLYGIGRNDGYACRDLVEPDPFARKKAAQAAPGLDAPIAPIQAIEPGYATQAIPGRPAIPSGPAIPGGSAIPGGFPPAAPPTPAPGADGGSD